MTTEEPRTRGLFSRIPVPAFLDRDSELARWFVLVRYGVGTAIGIGLLVVGTGLVALGLIVVLNGFGTVTINVDNELGASLAGGLVIGVSGGLALGLGVESQAGHGFVRRAHEPWEIAVAHLPGIAVLIWLLSVVRSAAERILPNEPDSFALIPRYLSAVGSGWLLVTLIGVGGLWAIHQFVVPRETRVADIAPAVLYIVWVITAVMAF